MHFDDTRMLLTEARQAYMDLYDATTKPPTPINRITTTDGTFVNSFSGDAFCGFTDPNRIYYVPWASGAHRLELRYVDVSKCTRSNCALTPITIHKFSCQTDATSFPAPVSPGTELRREAGAKEACLTRLTDISALLATT